MIAELSVRNFGPMKDTQTLSFVASSDSNLEEYYVVRTGGLRLLKMALLYGPNASGKTTLINALQFLRRLMLIAASDKSETLEFQPFKFRKEKNQPSTEFSLTFIIDDVRYDYKVEFSELCILNESMHYYPEGRKAVLFFRETDVSKTLATVHFGSTLKVSKKDLQLLEGNTLWNATVVASFGKTNINIPALQKIRHWFESMLMPPVYPYTRLTTWAIKELSSPKGDELKEQVKAFLSGADVQIADFIINHKEKELTGEEKDKFINLLKGMPNFPINLPQGEEVLRIKEHELFFNHLVHSSDGKNMHYSLDSNEESTGTIRYFGLSTILARMLLNNHIVPIDEIESSLHPDLLKHFLLTFLANTANRNTSQLLLTTHNLDFLENRDILRNDVVWFTEKQPDGSTSLYSLADFDTSVFRKGGSVTNAYKTGKLGAKPKLGSIFSSISHN